MDTALAGITQVCSPKAPLKELLATISQNEVCIGLPSSSKQKTAILVPPGGGDCLIW
jgi:hypothetical protein